jgi:putative transposase
MIPLFKTNGKSMQEKYPWRTGRHCISKIYNHLIFVTKYRRNVFTTSMLSRMQEIFEETCEQMDSHLLEFGGEDDHVHLLVESPPKLALSHLIGKLKGKSSYVLRKEFLSVLKLKLWGNHLWSPSYCVVSGGGARLDIIKKYLEDQRQPTSEKSALISRREKGHRNYRAMVPA